VIIPIYNAGSYLSYCLDSVLTQSHRDLQVICVDDGSTDNSVAELASVASRDQRLEWITQQNAGPGAARNWALGRIAGEYLMFVDADDVVPADAIQQLLGSLTASGSDLVSGRVMRLAGTLTWPSTLHEKALLRPRIGTHISADPSLVFDTTAWNKLFRRDFWVENSFSFPEGVLFEDTSLMIEAHCRAGAVDIIDDVVYHWRRREDGTLSITMRRDDLANLSHRIASLQRVRCVLRELSTPAVQQAAEVKFLKQDLGLYLTELEYAPPDFQEHFVRVVREFVADSPETSRQRLTPAQRIAYHVVQAGDTTRLVEFLGYLRENGGRLPLRRRGLRISADLGPVKALVPPMLNDAHRQLPLKMGVEAVDWEDDQLVIEGYGFIEGVPYEHPAAAVRRLKIVDRDTQRANYVWVRPRRNVASDLRDVSNGGSHRWSGFRATVPLTLLDPGPGRGAARWEVFLQVLTLGAASGDALGPPRTGGAWFAPVKHGPGGLVVALRWASEKRLVLQAKRMAYMLTAVERVDGRFRLEVRGLQRGILPPAALALHNTGNANLIMLPLDWTYRPDGGIGIAWLDPEQLAGRRGGLPHLAYTLVTCNAEAFDQVTTNLRCEVTATVGEDALIIRENGMGATEVVLSGPRVAVTSISWDEARLVVRGICTLPAGKLPGLAWRNGAGEEIQAEEARDGDDFVATFEPLCLDGPDGRRRLPSGYWALMRSTVEEGWLPIVAARGSQSALESASSALAPDIAIWVDRHNRVSMQVHALPVAERGALAQEKLRRLAYRPAIRSPLVNTVLIECWSGKHYADNPRALIERALAWSEGTDIAVAVSDWSIALPEQLRPVLRWSRAYYELLGRAKLIVANDVLSTHYVKRPGQQYLQTWHGTPLKRIGFDIERIHFRNKNYLEELRAETSNWDWLVSPNPYSTEIMRRAFAYDGTVLETGYPRNDLLAGPDAEARSRRREAARRWLGLAPDHTALLWAPTWRDDAYSPNGGYTAMLQVEVEELRALLPPGFVVLFRGHQLTSRSQSRLGGTHGFMRNVSAYPDLRDLMLASDALITDYSSIMFDYVLLRQPMILFARDLEHYCHVRGLYVDPTTIAPGPVLASPTELSDALRALPELSASYEDRQQAMRDRFCALEDGFAAQRVWDAVKG
jgi:CDP-glycerol glycerophosphotransferase